MTCTQKFLLVIIASSKFNLSQFIKYFWYIICNNIALSD